MDFKKIEGMFYERVASSNTDEISFDLQKAKRIPSKGQKLVSKIFWKINSNF